MLSFPGVARPSIPAFAGMTTVFLLSACSASAPDPVAAAPDADRIDCALAGAADFAKDCSVERNAGSDGVELILRHRDGGFRRLLITDDGRGVIAADGAQAAAVAIIPGNAIEVTLGGDRYRLPATIKGAPAPAR